MNNEQQVCENCGKDIYLGRDHKNQEVWYHHVTLNVGCAVTVAEPKGHTFEAGPNN